MSWLCVHSALPELLWAEKWVLVIRSIEADERIFLPHEVSRLFCDERYKVVHILFSSPKMYILTTALPAGDRNRRIMLPAVSH